MRLLDTILLLVAAVCFGLAAGNVRARINLVALGLLAFTLVPLISALHSY